MCENLSRCAENSEVIATITHLKNFHEKREAMGALTISLVWS